MFVGVCVKLLGFDRLDLDRDTCAHDADILGSAREARALPRSGNVLARATNES